MGVSAGLTLVKLTVALYTGSLALLGSALDSGLDLAASGVNAAFLRHAHVPADDDHPFGHGKAEGVASLIQGFLISFSGLGLLGESIRRILSGAKVAHTGEGAVVLALSIPVSIFLGLHLRKTGKRHGSLALQADALHYLSDVTSVGGSLVALLLIEFGAPALLDPIASLLISGYILHTAWTVSRKAYDILLDQALPEAAAIVEAAAARHRPQCLGVHGLRARASGFHRFVEFRLYLDRTLSFVDAHHVTEEISAEIQERLGPGTEVIAHPDPVDPASH